MSNRNKKSQMSDDDSLACYLDQEVHLDRKEVNASTYVFCDDFNSQEYVLEGKTHSIGEYITLLGKEKPPKKIYDKHKNEIIFCSGKKVKPYFRRLGDGSTGEMTDWHKDWQKRFRDFTEKKYQNVNMIKKYRRTDVDLDDHYNIEFQHSQISKVEVDDRLHDYALCNKQIIWIIYGGNSIKTVKEDEETVTLEFVNNPWKYQSFMGYHKIYLDVDGKIYSIILKKVRSGIITVEKPKKKDRFCELLKNPDKLPEILVSQASMYVKQQGAGNGKTYGTIQLLQKSRFKHYETLIYLTKQHSAVHVIYSEFNDQLKRKKNDDGEFKIKLSHVSGVRHDNSIPKKHIVTFTDTKTNMKRKIIVATFDSFMYALGNQGCQGVDKFQRMVQSIVDDELRCTNNGDMKYAGGVRLNKKLLLVGDEMQDLHENYMKAVMKIMEDRHVDFYAVGDKLQSISIEKNAFTYLMDAEPTDIIEVSMYPFRNECRRFNHPQLIKFVNAMIPFKKYGLPEIKLEEIEHNNDALDIFSGKPIYGASDSKEKVHDEVEIIMKKYVHEAENVKDRFGNTRKPNSFLIVTPFVKQNPLVEALHDSIREYWRRKNPSKHYAKYSVFHKSSDGTVIDLSESDDCTRIVSIHSSKGDGRDVVFVFGFTEEGLKIYSKKSENLIYDSLLHVGLTRMKEKLYFRVEANGDHIHRKIQKYQLDNNDFHDVKPILKISDKIKLDDLVQNSGSREETFLQCYERIIRFSRYDNIYDPSSQEDEGIKNKDLIDFKHHCIRYAVFKMLLVTKIMNDNITNPDRSYQQLYQILKHKYDIKEYNCVKDYHNFLCKRDSDRHGVIPVLKCTNSKDHFDDIIRYIEQIKTKLNAYMNRTKKLEFDPIESVVLHYMVETCDHGKFSALPVSDMYDIVDIYKKTASDAKKYDMNIADHHNKVVKVDNMYDKCSSKYPNLLWLVDHCVRLNGNGASLNIYKRFPLIGYNSENVLICYIKPQFSSLNFNELMMDSIFDTYLVMNVKNDDQRDRGTTNYEKFNRKKIAVCVFTLDHDDPYFFEWDNDGKNLINQKFIGSFIKENTINAYRSQHSSIYLFYKYWTKKGESDDTKNVIRRVRNEYEKICDKCPPNFCFPKYINDFLASIEDKVYDDDNVFKKYDDQKYFENELDRKLTQMIDRFFL